MKYLTIALLLWGTTCCAQGWEADFTLGTAGYNGDLTERSVTFKAMKPSFGFNVRYNVDNRITFRGGLTYAQLSADDKNNKNIDLSRRNLNFTTDLWEASFCAEVNLMDPAYYTSYPYLFGGIGLFRFNPYTFDKDDVKTFLRPLSTEGQGISAYPERKPYSLTQACMPLGAGWRTMVSNRCDIVLEAGVRLLFTDYLDDVSTTYVDGEVLFLNRGAKAVELSNRTIATEDHSGMPAAGDARGNSKIKDSYYTCGLKLIIRLGGE